MGKKIIETGDVDFYTQRLAAFGQFLNGCYYTTSFGLTKFELRMPKESFTIDLLKDFFSTDLNISIDGSLIPVSFQEVKTRVSKGLSFRGISHEDEGCIALDSRNIVFWSIVQQALNAGSPDKCFQYDGNMKYFIGDLPWMWDIFYILIKDNIGILLVCAATNE